MDEHQGAATLTVVVDAPELMPRAERLAADLGDVPVTLRDDDAAGRDKVAEAGGASSGSPPLVLRVGREGLTLSLGAGPEVGAARRALVPERGHGPDPLWRAVLAGEHPVVDATAGLGADGFRLAAKGARVTLIERSPAIGALLREALEDALAGDLGPDAANAARRVRLLMGDARDLLRRGAVPRGSAAVVYLDPMFHAAGRRSLPPKGMALFRAVLGTDDDGAADLLAAARETASIRVVVKRHLKAPPLAGVRPSGEIRARSVRYDLYPPL